MYVFKTIFSLQEKFFKFKTLKFNILYYIVGRRGNIYEIWVDVYEEESSDYFGR